MTTPIQKWVYKGEHVGETRYITPWGMKATFGHVLSTDSCRVKQFLPPTIKAKVGDAQYSREQMKVVIEDTGHAEPKEYYRVFCRTCASDPELLPALLKQHSEALGSSKPDVWSLIQNFDALKIPSEKINFVGCFLPWDPILEAGPSARRFLRECSEHVQVSHVYTKVVSNVATAKRKQQYTIWCFFFKKNLFPRP